MPTDGLPRTGTIAVAGGKGGSGKTTATLGLGLALARRGLRPLLADADVDVPDLHIRAGVDREPGLPAIRDGRRPTATSQTSGRFPGLEIVAAGTDRIATAGPLADLAALGRPVLIDCPAGAGPDAADPLRVADATVVVATATRAGRADATKTARMARALDAEPAAWIERSPTGLEPAADPPVGEPRVEVPEADRQPLQADAVREAFERLARRLYGRPVETTTPGKRPDSHVSEYGRNL